MISKIKKASKWDWMMLLIIIAILAGFFVIVRLKVEGFLLDSGDTAVAEQAIWNTVHGDWFRQSFLDNQNNFREHLNFIQFLYLPFYEIFPNLYTLYLLIDFSYGIAAFFLYLFVKKKLGYWWAIALTLFFLLNPIVVLTNTATMHVVATGAPFLLLSFIFYEDKKYIPWLVFFLIFATTSEFVAPTAFIFGLLAFWEKREWKWVLPPVISGALMYLLSVFYITIGFAQSNTLFRTFNPSNFADNNVSKRLSILEEFFRPVLYWIPFFSKYFFLLIPTILLDLVVINKGRLSSGSHLYTLWPVILIMITFDLANRASQKTRKLILASIVLGIFVSVPIWKGKMDIKPDRRAKEMKEAVTMVKDGGSVTASRDISYHLSHRSELYLVDNARQSDYVVLDMSFTDSKKDQFEPYIQFIANSDDYIQAMNKNSIVVYIKKEKMAELKNNNLIK